MTTLHSQECLCYKQGHGMPCPCELEKRCLLLWFGLGGRLLRLLRRARAAGGRDDAVHPQVLDHLAVVVHRVKGADIGDRETRGEEWEYRLG